MVRTLLSFHAATGQRDGPLRRFPRLLALLALLALLVCVVQGRPANADDMRLRLAWGGGEAATWQGSIALSEGSFRQARCLGSDPDGLAAMGVEQATILVLSERPRSYQAVDVTVDAPLTARLEFLMSGATTGGEPRRLGVTLQDLVQSSYNQALDTAGNRLLVRRVPGDELRVRCARDHLIFSPGEIWGVELSTCLPAMANAPRLDLSARIVKKGADQALWKSDSLSLRRQDDGQFATGRWQVPVPTGEGVYELVIQWGFAGSRNLFLADRQMRERRVQFLVLESSPPRRPAASVAWKEVIRFNAAEPKWWEPLARLPAWQPLRLTMISPQGMGTAQASESGKNSQLAPQGWQLYPLPVAHPGRPHRLAVDFAGHSTATLGISVVEPGPEGAASLSSVDTAVRIDRQLGPEGDRTCELLFWPQSRAPRLLLTNLDQEGEAFYGQIRMLEAPQHLPPALQPAPQRGYRQALLYLDRASFHQFFLAGYETDAESKRGLTDWQTFYDSGQRLIDYLHTAGYGGMVLTGVCEGSSLAALPSYAASPRFDSGAYFSNGQDLFPKDILEMLFRQFDREGLRLLVGLRFTTPLPELESLRRDPEAQAGIDLMHVSGTSYRAMRPMPQGEGPYYNPLDARVQEAMARVVVDVVDRYAHHPAFGGIALDLTPDSFALLPGWEWGYDAQTLDDFQRQLAPELRALATGQLPPLPLTQGPWKSAWLKWRCDRLTEWYRTVLYQMQRARPDAHLLLSTARLVEQGAVRAACRPQLPRASTMGQALQEMGLDISALAGHEGLVVPRPFRASAATAFSDRGADSEFSRLAEWRPLLPETHVPSLLHYPSQILHRLRMEPPVELFGVDLSRTQVQYGFAGDAWGLRSELAHALAETDCREVLRGSSVITQGYDPQVRDWLSVFRQLPERPFSDPPASVAGGHPVVARTLTHAGKSYVYAVNDAPWPVDVTITFAAASNCRLAELSPTRVAPVAARQWQPVEGGWSWQQRLEPYQLAAGMLTDPQARMVEVSAQLGSDANEDLRRRLTEVAARVNSLKRPAPLPYPANAGFETAGDSQALAGWSWTSQAGTTIGADGTAPYAGATSLQLHSERGIAWVRSDPLPVPKSGRLSLQCMVRVEPQGTAPPLRLAFEGMALGQPYYRYAQVTEETGQSLADGDWTPLVLHVDDLPSQDLQQLRVRFDLMGPGKVWIDDIRLYDLALTADEQLVLSKLVALADYQLRENLPGTCFRTLKRFWIDYLLDQAPASPAMLAQEPRGESGSEEAASGAENIAERPGGAAPPVSTGLLPRFRRLLPRWR